MKSLKRDIIVNSLLQKGFRRIPKKDPHRWYRFYYNDKLTDIRIKISTGSKHRVYGEGLISSISLKLKIKSFGNTIKFLSCDLSEDDYITILKRNGHL